VCAALKPARRNHALDAVGVGVFTASSRLVPAHLGFLGDSRLPEVARGVARRELLMHSTLAKIIATWRLSHWLRLYGRRPTLDDLCAAARPDRGMAAT
jgi:hypothetical protein